MLRHVERELVIEILSRIQYYGNRYGLVTSVLEYGSYVCELDL